MKYVFWILLILAVAFSSFSAAWILKDNGKLAQKTSFLTSTKEEESPPYEKYSIENLSNTNILPGKIKILDVIEEEENYTSYKFSFKFNPNLDGITAKQTSGQINIPSSSSTLGLEAYPIILMLRGYINQETFVTGDGTRNAASVFAKNGFITIAPDFLGYGDSDEEAGNIFETRFQTYVTALSLLKSLDKVETWDGNNIFIWAHSNGGQVALTTLEVLGEEIPTTLWAPVTKSFPHSVLFYTEDSVDGGKFIRRELAKFEELHDVDKYSLNNYLDDISSPIQLHQGTVDDAVPVEWNENFMTKLENSYSERDLNLDLNFYLYQGVDHNMRPIWDVIVEKDLDFFNSFID